MAGGELFANDAPTPLTDVPLVPCNGKCEMCERGDLRMKPKWDAAHRQGRYCEGWYQGHWRRFVIHNSQLVNGEGGWRLLVTVWQTEGTSASGKVPCQRKFYADLMTDKAPEELPQIT